MIGELDKSTNQRLTELKAEMGLTKIAIVRLAVRDYYKKIMEV